MDIFVKKNKNDNISQDVFEWFEALVYALSTVIIVFLFISRIITVSGASMQPTLNDRDMVFIQSILPEIKKGDVVVIDSYIEHGEPLIKRVIGTEGDTLNIDYTTGQVFVNDLEINEPYISDLTRGGYDVIFPITVEKGKLFVMGDNRPHSLDSRSSQVGQIDIRDILGKARLRVLPYDQIKTVE